MSVAVGICSFISGVYPRAGLPRIAHPVLRLCPINYEPSGWRRHVDRARLQLNPYNYTIGFGRFTVFLRNSLTPFLGSWRMVWRCQAWAIGQWHIPFGLNHCRLYAWILRQTLIRIGINQAWRNIAKYFYNRQCNWAQNADARLSPLRPSICPDVTHKRSRPRSDCPSITSDYLLQIYVDMRRQLNLVRNGGYHWTRASLIPIGIPNISYPDKTTQPAM